MRKLDTLVFTAQNQTQSVNRGKLTVSKNKRLPWLELEFSVTLNQATGGNATLTAAQVNTFLGGWSLSMKYGQGRQPFNAVDFQTLRQLARDALGNDFPGVGDSSTGLLKQLATATPTALTFYVQIPLGYLWKDDALKDMNGMGPTQAATVSFDVTRGTDALPANWTISGNPTAKIVLPERSARGDFWHYIPEYRQQSEANSVSYFAAGMPWLVFEKTAISSASSLTAVSVRVGGETIHDKVSAQEIDTQYTSDPELPAGGKVDDTYTVLLAYNARDKLREFAVGPVEVEQNTKDLATMTLGFYHSPVVPEAEVYADIKAAVGVLQREVRAMNAADFHRQEVADHLKAFLPIVLADAQSTAGIDAGFVAASPVADPHPVVPGAVAAKARARIAAHANPAGSYAELSRIIAGIPGGNPNPAGFRRGEGLGASAAANAAYRYVGGR